MRSDYPYILFQKTGELKFMIAKSKKEFRNTGVEIANYSELIKALGHNKTRKVFTSFGPEWIVTRDKVYFKNV